MWPPAAPSIRATPRRCRSPWTPRRRSTRATPVGGKKCRTDSRGQRPKGLDHDPPAPRKWTPLGILVLATGALTLIFGTRETSEFWADGLQKWWALVRGSLGPIKRLVIYLDNGPKNAGNRTQWLRRMVEFCDGSGLEIRLVYSP